MPNNCKGAPRPAWKHGPNTDTQAHPPTTNVQTCVHTYTHRHTHTHALRTFSRHISSTLSSKLRPMTLPERSARCMALLASRRDMPGCSMTCTSACPEQGYLCNNAGRQAQHAWLRHALHGGRRRSGSLVWCCGHGVPGCGTASKGAEGREGRIL